MEARLTDPGALLATTHEAGGLRVRLRLARPSDAPRVHDFLRNLSPETHRRRFGAAEPDSLVRHFTFYDPRRRMVVAASAPLNGHDHVVGLADVGFAGTGLAELGVVVDDRTQNRGVGKLLTEAVASLAIQQGASHLMGELPQADGPMLRLMERLGSTARTVEDGRPVVYTTLPGRRSRAA